MRRAVWVLCVLGAATGNGVAMQVPSDSHGAGQSLPPTSATRHPGESHRARVLRLEAARQKEAAAAAPSKSAPRPAVITLQDGVLTIAANDSGLRQILDTISGLGSMSIDGQIDDSRVFGSYGPGVPSAVISQLLEGAGYNVILAGVNDLGVPRKLVLTPKTGEVSPPSTPAVAAQPSQPDSPDGNTSEGEPLGPGAIANSPPPPSEDPEVRMKQRLERLQQMQDQQKQPSVPK